MIVQQPTAEFEINISDRSFVTNATYQTDAQSKFKIFFCCILTENFDCASVSLVAFVTKERSLMLISNSAVGCWTITSMKVDLGQNVRLVVSLWRFVVSSFRYGISSCRIVVSSFRHVVSSFRYGVSWFRHTDTPRSIRRIVSSIRRLVSFVVSPFLRFVMSFRRFVMSFRRFDSSTQRGYNSKYIT